MSTVYSAKPVTTGKKHWQTKEDILKPELMYFYNKYMGGVDVNDQLLKYSAYSRRSLKWWKVAFRLLNVALINAFILYKEWYEKRNQAHKKNVTHSDFRVTVLKQLLATVTEHANTLHDTDEVTENTCLGGRHFMSKNPLDGGKKVSCLCKVCNKAEKILHEHTGAPAKKKYGSVTSYWCKQCKVELCPCLCFELYHTQSVFCLFMLHNCLIIFTFIATIMVFRWPLWILKKNLLK